MAILFRQSAATERDPVPKIYTQRVDSLRRSDLPIDTLWAFNNKIHVH